jgi:hypothetical protein
MAAPGLTPAQRQASWENRANRFEQKVPLNFKQAMSDVKDLSLSELERMVYSSAKPNARGNSLKRLEEMRIISDTEAHLTNTATSEWAGTTTYYAWIVALGHGPLDKGKKYFVWMKDPMQKRVPGEAPPPGTAWWAHRIAAVAPKDWRKRAIDGARSRGVIATQLQNATREAMSDADRVEG